METILLGITGGIAAYKMVEVASRLTKMEYEVRVVMTEAATEFISPLTFEALTHRPVETDIFSFTAQNRVKHIELAQKADLVLIAPATANFLATMAGGFAPDLLGSVVLAVQSPIMVAPAMNVNMYKNPAVQQNIETLEQRGIEIITPDSGYLACGEEGKGRLPEPVDLVELVIRRLTPATFSGKSIMITAGPTREAIDPVRYISNYSSGKMGYALTKAAVRRGADVTLITGPTNLTPPPGVETFPVESAREMREEVLERYEEMDIIIMVAAVADYRPARTNKEKIKRVNKRELQLELKTNPDILQELGQKKNKGQIIVGFALESKDLLTNARTKLKEKNLDMIIANEVGSINADTNKAYILTADKQLELPRMSKDKLANKILEKIAQR